MESTGQWLEKALVDLCRKKENGLDLDGDIISGLVSYCDLASPLDAKEYLDNIIGQEAGKSVIDEYLKRRGYSEIGSSSAETSSSKLHAYVKPPSNEVSVGGTKKLSKAPKEVTLSSNQENRVPPDSIESKNAHRGIQGSSKKKKAGKAVSLADAAKGSIIFQQGKPCSCQARRHGLISNCLSCGKIVCEQEGEGPCQFCGALVLKEGSSYAGLDEGAGPLLSDAEVAAEAYAKRLVDYDRNSAARTTVIDDQSDYYEIEGNSWLSMEEKELLRKKREEIEEAEQARRNKVVIAFDLVGRKVLMNEDDISEVELDNGILRPPDERELNRIKPNPTLKVQPIFIDPGHGKRPTIGNHLNKGKSTGLCLEISGRVQHDNNTLKRFMMDDQPVTS
ncbi:hypothetical protein Vadar_009785 [Vaccinium darrowii]|uniref:Uncharacterized protein n=1 Tax=Vaccinium darrowii TaxID=229202 RepID=A0ACB7YCQ7_9ERIC|nr:hypothetical protein Vadar_009785 [Vaccinium darrowii]